MLIFENSQRFNEISVGVEKVIRMIKENPIKFCSINLQLRMAKELQLIPK